jgi:hypothetical protein
MFVATAMVELSQILRDAVESRAVGNPTWPMADILPVTSNVAANVRQSSPPDGQFGMFARGGYTSVHDRPRTIA